MPRILSIIIPCYNEEKYVEKVLNRVIEVTLNYNIAKEIIIVNDGSTDNTQSKIDSFLKTNPLKIIRSIQHPKNMGKGSCIKSALPFVKGEILVIQDADLEYDPQDYNRMLAPIIDGHADVVLGSRFRGSDPHRGPFLMHSLVNKIFTFISNVLSQQSLTDIHTCYKMYKTDVIRSINLKENRFGIDPEIIAKLGHKKYIKIYEVGISYYGRSFTEGKKISWHDGFRALYCIIKYNIFNKK